MNNNSHILHLEFTSTSIISRHEVRAFFERIEKKSPTINLDFRNVYFVSRTSAHEFILQSQELAKSFNVQIEIVNCSYSVKRMFAVVRRSFERNTRFDVMNYIEHLKFENETERNRYLLSI
jgi:anti-anti-sigma regulatory factor